MDNVQNIILAEHVVMVADEERYPDICLEELGRIMKGLSLNSRCLCLYSNPSSGIPILSSLTSLYLKYLHGRYVSLIDYRRLNWTYIDEIIIIHLKVVRTSVNWLTVVTRCRPTDINQVRLKYEEVRVYSFFYKNQKSHYIYNFIINTHSHNSIGYNLNGTA
jgi:hypothetical protein